MTAYLLAWRMRRGLDGTRITYWRAVRFARVGLADAATLTGAGMNVLSLDAIDAKWLRLCAACDAGLTTACTCCPDDHRPVILALVRRVQELEARAI